MGSLHIWYIVLQELTPTDLLTVALVFFAGAQVWAMDRTERRAVAERQRDDQKARDSAMQVLMAEQLRLSWWADQVEEVGTIPLIASEMLPASEIPPAHPDEVLRAAVVFGHGAAFLATVGINSATLAALLAGRARHHYEMRAHKYPGSHPMSLGTFIAENFGHEFKEKDDKLVAELRRAADAFIDAVNCSPTAQRMPLDYVPENPVSVAGKELLEIHQAGVAQTERDRRSAHLLSRLRRWLTKSINRRPT